MRAQVAAIIRNSHEPELTVEEEHEISKYETAADVEDKIQELEDLYQVRPRLHCAIDALLLVTEASRTSLMSLAFTLRLCLMMMFKKVIVIMMVMMMVMMMMMMMIMSVPGVPSLLAFKR